MGTVPARSTRYVLVAALAAALLVCSLIATASARADDPATGGGVSTEILVKKGDRGSGVKAIQRRLGLKADGVFGPGTAKAVKRFQKRNDIEADGVVGPATRRAMSLKPFTTASVKSKGSKRKTSKSGGNAIDVLERIADCESGGDPTAVSKNGKYFGKYQFSKATWKAQGGQGTDPSAAAEAEQDRVALKLYKAEGTDPWPVCGKDESGS